MRVSNTLIFSLCICIAALSLGLGFGVGFPWGVTPIIVGIPICTFTKTKEASEWGIVYGLLILVAALLVLLFFAVP